MERTRNYGVDLLRILAMLLIVIYHLIGHGGIRDATVVANAGQFAVVWFFEVLAYCGVNIFALISGYVGYKEDDFRTKYSNIIMLWLQVFFYGVLFLVIEFLLTPETIGLKTIAGSVLPVAFGEYWYFSAYFGVFLLSPILNRIVFYSDAGMKYFVGIIVVFFSFYSTIAGRFSDPFGLNNGHSFLWLLVLYLLGAWIKKCQSSDKIRTKHLLVILLICFLVTWLIKLVCSFMLAPLMGDSFHSVGNLLIYYLSPTTLGIALCSLMLFCKFNISSVFIRIVKVISPLTFGVYIIHEDLYVKELFIMDKFSFIAKLSVWKVPLAIVGYAGAVFLICCCIEWCRGIIFKIFKIRKLVEFVECKLRTVCENMVQKITRMP